MHAILSQKYLENCAHEVKNHLSLLYREMDNEQKGAKDRGSSKKIKIGLEPASSWVSILNDFEANRRGAGDTARSGLTYHRTSQSFYPFDHPVKNNGNYFNRIAL